MQKFNDAISNSNTGKHAIHISHDPHKHVQIKSFDGMVYNIKASQAYMGHHSTINSFINPLGSYSQPWGSSIDIELKNSSTHSNVRAIYLNMRLQNSTGGTVETVAADKYFNYIEFLTSTGSRIVQLYPENISDGQDIYNEEEWFYLKKLIGRDDHYRPEDNVFLNGDIKERYIRLLDDPFSSNEFFIPALSEILTIRFWFHPTSVTNISGNALTITNMRLMFVSNYDVDFNFNKQMSMYRNNVLAFNYNYPLIQRYTQTFGAGSYEFVLTGFNSMIPTMYFKLVPQNPVGRNLEVQYPIESFEFLSEDGTNIQGSTIRTDREDYLNYHDLYRNLHRENNYIYRYNFCKDPIAWRTAGVITGYHIFNTRQILRINTVIETQRVLTYTGTNPTSGYYRFRYREYVSDGLVFNANAAAIEAAIEALHPFKSNNVSVTASAALTNGMTISYGGVEADVEKELIEVEPLTLDSYFDVAETTSYVKGLPASGSYTLIVWADSVGKMMCKNGAISTKLT